MYQIGGEGMRMNSARLGNAVRIVAPDKFKGSLSAGEAAPPA
jgi:hypothetical protein